MTLGALYQTVLAQTTPVVRIVLGLLLFTQLATVLWARRRFKAQDELNRLLTKGLQSRKTEAETLFETQGTHTSDLRRIENLAVGQGRRLAAVETSLAGSTRVLSSGARVVVTPPAPAPPAPAPAPRPTTTAVLPATRPGRRRKKTEDGSPPEGTRSALERLLDDE